MISWSKWTNVLGLQESCGIIKSQLLLSLVNNVTCGELDADVYLVRQCNCSRRFSIWAGSLPDCKLCSGFSMWHVWGFLVTCYPHQQQLQLCAVHFIISYYINRAVWMKFDSLCVEFQWHLAISPFCCFQVCSIHINITVAWLRLSDNLQLPTMLCVE